ncbi:MAG: ATP-binding protein, partial [Candidatus Methanomethylicia archaeon]
TSSREDYFEYLIYSEVIAEGDGFDLLPMGRPEGPGCYCYINHVLRKIIDKLSRNYDYVIMDTEAGLEHLSRRTTRDVNVMLIVTDPSIRGILTAKRIRDLSIELDTKIRRFYIVANRIPKNSLNYIRDEIEKIELELIGCIPEDQNILIHDLRGLPITKISGDSPAVKAIEKIMAKILMIKTEDSISKILG